MTTYFEFPGTFTTNLKASVNSCRLDLVYLHNMMMKLLEMLKIISSRSITNSERDGEFTQEKYGSREERPWRALRDGVNEKLMQLEDFGGIEECTLPFCSSVNFYKTKGNKKVSNPENRFR